MLRLISTPFGGNYALYTNVALLYCSPATFDEYLSVEGGGYSSSLKSGDLFKTLGVSIKFMGLIIIFLVWNLIQSLTMKGGFGSTLERDVIALGERRELHEILRTGHRVLLRHAGEAF